MKLSDFDLRQMDSDWVDTLPDAQLRPVINRLLESVKELTDRLNMNPSNSSQPPSSRLPWDSGKSSPKEDDEEAGIVVGDKPPEDAAAEPAQASAPAAKESAAQPSKAASKKKGKQKGSPGYGRTQKLAVTATREHRPGACSACGAGLQPNPDAKCYTAWNEIDIAERGDGETGIAIACTRHELYEGTCHACGHVTRAAHYHAPPDSLWENTELAEWRLVGPRLAAMIVLLGMRMRLSRARIREFLVVFLGISLSIGTIDQTIRESARACVPLEDTLVEEIILAEQLYIDETSWKEAGVAMMLWVITSATVVFFMVGPRTFEMIFNVLGDRFKGILMSDGYTVYRHWLNRLRCWAHLDRKIKGLCDSTDLRIARVGKQIFCLVEGFKAAIYAARATPGTGPPSQVLADEIASLKRLCERYRDDKHEKLRALAREFLYDWDVIIRPLAEPHLPLTNNEAERALRHWVISRLISQGTRTATGSRAFALLASVIETCRRRDASPWHYLGSVIHAARRGLPLPALPLIQVSAAAGV